MLREPLNPPTLTGAESTAKIIKNWLIDEKKSRSGLLGVNDALQVVSVRTFQHGLTQASLRVALDDAIRGSGTGVVAYGVSPEGSRPSFDPNLIEKLSLACEYLNVTLLDVVIFSSLVPKGWLSARQQNLLG